MALAIGPVAGDVDFGDGFDVVCGHVPGVEEDDFAAHADATVAVVESVDGGVELVVAAEGLEDESAFGNLELVEGGGGEIGFGVGGVPDSFFGGVGEVEAAGLAGAVVVVFEPGDDGFDFIADVVVVVPEGLPVDIGFACEGGFGEAGDDGGFAEKVFAGGGESSTGLLDDAHGVFAGNELGTGGLFVVFGAAEAGEDEANFSGDEV